MAQRGKRLPERGLTIMSTCLTDAGLVVGLAIGTLLCAGAAGIYFSGRRGSWAAFLSAAMLISGGLFLIVTLQTGVCTHP